MVTVGLADLAAGRRTVEALLVASASVRLGELGFPIARSEPNSHLELYALLAEQQGDDAAHSRYNALRRRLVSFMRSATAASRRR